MKYIMFKVEFRTLTMYEPVLFGNGLVHREVAKHMKPMVMRNYPTAERVTIDSAGDVAFYKEQLVRVGITNVPLAVAICSGRSESLDLESKKDRDSHIITTMDYGGNMG